VALDERDAMLRRIAALPVRQRIVVALRYYEGLTDEQIADVIGCRPATVRSHAARALATLRTDIRAQTSSGTGGRHG
jgi:RNA polymerase sigma factor (sigma-70 family)